MASKGIGTQSSAGRFEALATLLGALLTGIYLIGLLERADRTALRMGYDSWAVLITYGGGIVALIAVSR